jgi:hypothetical protein
VKKNLEARPTFRAAIPAPESMPFAGENDGRPTRKRETIAFSPLAFWTSPFLQCHTGFGQQTLSDVTRAVPPIVKTPKRAFSVRGRRHELIDNLPSFSGTRPWRMPWTPSLPNSKPRILPPQSAASGRHVWRRRDQPKCPSDRMTTRPGQVGIELLATDRGPARLIKITIGAFRNRNRLESELIASQQHATPSYLSNRTAK